MKKQSAPLFGKIPPVNRRGAPAISSKSLAQRGSFKKKHNRLSSREMEVLQLIAEGKPNKQVAAELGVSFKRDRIIMDEVQVLTAIAEAGCNPSRVSIADHLRTVGQGLLLKQTMSFA
jgi:FixJ family two-component response regulator